MWREHQECHCYMKNKCTCLVFNFLKLFLGCSQHSDDENDACHHKNIALKATHAGRVKTDVPIYGVLTQPYTSAPETPNRFGAFEPVY